MGVSAIVAGFWRNKILSGFLTLATRPAVVRRSSKTALVVGILLVAINQGDTILAADWGSVSWPKILLTFLVPYGVSTYAAVGMMRDQQNTHDSTNNKLKDEQSE